MFLLYVAVSGSYHLTNSDVGEYLRDEVSDSLLLD